MYGRLLCFQLEMSSEKFPISFDDIWEKAGYTERVYAVRAFQKCVASFNLKRGSEYKSLKIFIPNKPDRPGQTFKMTIGTAKRFLASAQTQKGHPVIQSIIVSMKPTTTRRNHFWGLEGVIFIDVATFLRGCGSFCESVAHTPSTSIIVSKCLARDLAT